MTTDQIETADPEEPGIRLRISEKDCRWLAAGYVPKHLQANCLGVLALFDGSEDERRSKRPEPKKRKGKAA